MFCDCAYVISLSTFLQMCFETSDEGSDVSFCCGSHEIVLLVFYCISKFGLSFIRAAASVEVHVLEARREQLPTSLLCSVGTVVFHEISTHLPFIRHLALG